MPFNFTIIVSVNKWIWACYLIPRSTHTCFISIKPHEIFGALTVQSQFWSSTDHQKSSIDQKPDQQLRNMKTYTLIATLLGAAHVLLSRFYLDFLKTHFIQILSRFYPNFWKNLDKIWINLEKTLYPDFILILSRYFQKLG